MKYYSRRMMALLLAGGLAAFDFAVSVPPASAQDTPAGARQGEGNAQPQGGFGQGRRGRRGRGGFGQGVEGGTAEQGPGGGRGQRGGRDRGGNENAGDQLRGAPGPGGMTATDPIERARQTMERMDRNQDGVLQADESRFLRGMATQADSNRDGVLSRSELETNFASNPMPGGGVRGGGRGGNDQSSDEGGRGRRGRNNDEQNNDGNSGGRGNENANQRNREQINDSSRQGNDSNRRNREQQGGGEKKEPEVAKTLPSLLTGSYRIKPAKDGLPKELPSWFTALVASRDANADGQLSMNEYASRFTERVAAEFTRRDANNDGVITPDEALKSR